MRAIDRMIGITAGLVLAAAGPALAGPVRPAPTIGWTTADAVAAQRVTGDILATRLENDGGRAVYDVDIRAADRRLEEVRVDAHTGTVLGVRAVAEPGVGGETEAP